MENDAAEGHRSGFVAVAGKPNVGKSTLVNRYVGQSVAAVSPRPQTTRRNQFGIVTLPHAQLIFVDTPGIHRPKHSLGRRMNAWAEHALADGDVVLVVFDLDQEPDEEDTLAAKAAQSTAAGRPVVTALNKRDLVAEELRQARALAYAGLLPAAESWPISALQGDGTAELLDRLTEILPEGPRYFPSDQVTDAVEREIAVELIRSACLDLLRHEVPHAVAVRLDEYRDRGEDGAYLAATLFVERESQKPIVIGKGGRMLKQIGTRARQEIESLTGRRVYLDLRVKVEPGWRDNEAALGRLGFAGAPRGHKSRRP